MAYSIKTREEDGILIFEIADATNDDDSEVKAKVLPMVSALSPKGVIFDVRRCRERPNPSHLYARLYGSPVYKQFPAGIPMAVVDIEEHQPLREFHQDLAANRGILMGCFMDVDAAKHWLVQQHG